MNMQGNTATVVELRPAKKERQQASEKKWGKAVLGLGFSILPSLIFRAQARLGVSPVALLLLLHLADYWWQQERLPYPSKAALAERMSLSARQIQRYLTELEDAKLIERVERYAGHKGQQSNGYNLAGLVKKLKDLEPEFSEVKEQSKRVVKRGGLARMKQENEKKKDE